MAEKRKELPSAVQDAKGLPQVGSPENSIIIGETLVEIKPTKLRYQRNRTAAFYKILELYPLVDVLAMEAGAFGDNSDGNKDHGRSSTVEANSKSAAAGCDSVRLPR